MSPRVTRPPMQLRLTQQRVLRLVEAGRVKTLSSKRKRKKIVHKIPSIIYVTRRTTMNIPNDIPNLPNNAGGRPVGSTNWSQQELVDLFTVMEEILPVGSDQWQQLAQLHANKYPNRDLNAIRRKYNVLSRKPIPTGDPMCPPEVKWADG